jgi:IS5 family transposase
MSQHTFFDVEKQLDKIKDINDCFFRLKKDVKWNIFRDALKSIRTPTDPENGGRPHFDELLMFKILVLKHLFNLSDDQTELQIRDRLSFRFFLDLDIADTVPDSRTIWNFGDKLQKENMGRHLFDVLNEELLCRGLLVQGGTIIDSTIVEVPVQHNSRSENKEIKKGKVPQRFIDNPNVGRQKDLDATWKTKNGEDYFGYENHCLADEVSKFIMDYEVTPASVHDSQPAPDLFPPEPYFEGQQAFGDSAYSGAELVADLTERGFDVQMLERAYRNKPLSYLQKLQNFVKSHSRCRIEHIFGMCKQRMKDEMIRVIGLNRARFCLGMCNLVYNMTRYSYFCRVCEG